MRRLLEISQRLESVGRLAGGVAHDFNNILAAIRGCNEMLVNGLPKDHPVRPWADLAIEATVRGEALVRQLLAVGRRQDFEPRVMDLGEVVRDAEALLGRLAGEGVRVVIDAPDSIRAIVDPRLLSQVLMNLVANARDAMPDAVPGRWAILEVSDTGIGIDRDLLPRIFDPFVTTKADSGGTGLGLSVVYGIVRQHGGWIAVQSEVGRGTVFRLFLPVPTGPSISPGSG